MKNNNLDKKDLALLNFVGQYNKIHQVPPTMRQCSRLLFGSWMGAAIHDRLNKLVQLGYIVYLPGKSRTIHRTKKPCPALDT